MCKASRNVELYMATMRMTLTFRTVMRVWMKSFDKLETCCLQ